jgi:hypothetical protein
MECERIGYRPVLSGVGLTNIEYVQSPYFYTFRKPRNRFQGRNSASLCSLTGRYVNPIPPRFLAPIDSLKIPAQNKQMRETVHCTDPYSTARNLCLDSRARLYWCLIEFIEFIDWRYSQSCRYFYPSCELAPL